MWQANPNHPPPTMSSLTPFITLAGKRLTNQLQNVQHYLSGAQPRHDRLAAVIQATAAARAKSREDVRLCVGLNNVAQGIIDQADEAVTAQMEANSGDEEVDASKEVEEMKKMRTKWGELRKVKVMCLRLEHMFHVIEGLLGEE
jgi:hypothetical protein